MPVAIITGASRGFGRAMATDLVKDGWKLVIDGRRAADLGQAEQGLTGLGGVVRAIVGDVADPEHRAALVAAAAELGGVDLLVNNASELGPSPLPNLDRFPLDVLREVYEVNVIAPLGLVQLTLPQLRRSTRGVVVSMSSDAAVEAYQGWGGYGSSKSALDQLHRVLAAEEPALLVYQFDPGDMRTGMHRAAFPGEDISDRPEPDSVVPALRRLLESGSPSGRYRAADWGQS